MSLNRLLDLEGEGSRGINAEPEGRPQFGAPGAGLYRNVADLSDPNINPGHLISADDDNAAGEIEWEDESDVNLVLRASSRGVASHSPSPSRTAELNVPIVAADASSHCDFKEEVIGGGADDGDGVMSQYEDLLPGLYFIGIHRIEVLKDQRACLLIVRPDVAASAILDLVEQVSYV